MPPKNCGKCSKIVYPTEEIKCLDKVWHKGCFKCEVCSMTLNMKNYKGYDKLPYCNAHYPKSKPTTVADTPEIRRIAENTKIQSNIAYHQEFEASKHAYTQILDTPEMRTHLANTKNISMIKYHEEFEKQKGKKITVADDPEVMRVRQNMEIISNVSYHGDKTKREQMEMARPAEQVEGQQAEAYERRSSGNYAQSGEDEDDSEAGRPYRQNVGSISEYDPMTGQGAGGTPYSNRNSAGARQVYDSNVGKVVPPGYAPVQAPGHRPVQAPGYAQAAPVTQPSRYANPYGNLPRGYYNDDDTEFSSRDARRRISQGSVKNRVDRFSTSGDDDQLEATSARKIGSITDYDPLNEKYGSIAGQYESGQKKAQQPPQQQYQPPQQQYRPPSPQPAPPQQGQGLVCQALYDYDAADADEVSFQEGDKVIFCQPIDAGWMEGTVERTGQRGMLPSNYVEKIRE